MTLSGLRTGWFVVAWAAAAVGALLWLPYRFAVAANFSDSYLFGFNNRVGLAIVLVFAAGVALWAPDLAVPKAEAEAKRLGRSTLYKAVGLTLLFSGAIYWLTRGLGGVDESVYLIDRVKLALEGRVAYRDFEWPYGLGLLYGPVWLARLGLPVIDAYGVFWVGLSAAGIGLLYQTVKWLEAPRRVFLLLVAVAWLALFCTGVNYSMFRFVLPCWMGLAVYRMLQRNEVGAILLVAPCYAALLLVSPELAVSFGLGMGGYLAVFGRWPLRNVAAAVGSLGLMAVVTVLAERRGVFLVMRAFGSGGFNFPIVPALHILVFLVAIALCAAHLGRQLRTRQGDPLVVLIAVSAAAVAGALGRCDAGHVFLDPMGITIAALVLGTSGSTLGRVWFAVVAFTFVAIPLPLNVAKASALAGYAQQQQAAPEGLDGKFAAPFGVTMGHFGTVHRAELEQGYYLGLTDAVTPEAVDAKIAELAAAPGRGLLLPEHHEDNCRMDAELHRRFLRILFLYPYGAPVRHPESIYAPLCSYIDAHYEPDATAARWLNYEVWKPR